MPRLFAPPARFRRPFPRTEEGRDQVAQIDLEILLRGGLAGVFLINVQNEVAELRRRRPQFGDDQIQENTGEAICEFLTLHLRKGKALI